MAKAVTLKTIAERLNISPSLVSRALTDKYGVSDDMRNLVKQTAAELGYTPRITPAVPGTRRKVLVFIDSGIATILNDTSLYSQIMNGLMMRLQQEDIGIEPIVTQYYRPYEIGQIIQEKKPFGLVLLGDIDDKYFKMMEHLSLPLVMIDNYTYCGNELDIVRANNFAVGHQAAGHLIANGHRNLAFVGNTLYSFSFQDRFDGFLNQIHRSTVNNIRWQCLEDDNPKHHICDTEILHRVLSSPDRPTAFVCANDSTALELYKAATSLGLSVPEDISLTGCDNNSAELERIVPKHFTTFSLNTAEIGKAGAELLLERNADPARPARYIQIAAYFIPGETVQPPQSVGE